MTVNTLHPNPKLHICFIAPGVQTCQILPENITVLHFWNRWCILVSSTCEAVFVWWRVASGRSLMNCVKRSGPTWLPWGTPEVTNRLFEAVLSITTLCDLGSWETNLSIDLWRCTISPFYKEWHDQRFWKPWQKIFVCLFLSSASPDWMEYRQKLRRTRRGTLESVL